MEASAMRLALAMANGTLKRIGNLPRVWRIDERRSKRRNRAGVLSDRLDHIKRVCRSISERIWILRQKSHSEAWFLSHKYKDGCALPLIPTMAGTKPRRPHGFSALETPSRLPRVTPWVGAFAG